MANEVVISVTRDHRLQSYVAVAQGGPAWLSTLIMPEASVNVSA